MPELQTISMVQQQVVDWASLAESLGKQFAARETEADESDLFVADNIARLKSVGLTAAGVPSELGGGGASYADLCTVLRILGRYCSSTALAFSMHTHQVMIPTWRWQHQNAPVDGLLKRVAAEQLVLLSSGGSDWLQSAGTAVKVEGGFLISARKVFASGAPVANLLMTSAVYQDPELGSTVLHFGVPMTAQGVSIEPTWQAMGMRGTGSHDVVLSDVFVPDAAVALRREQGKWHFIFHLISMIAIPLIYSVYVGVAEAARDRAVQLAMKRHTDEHCCYMVGGLDNELMAAKLALQHMISTAVVSQPSFETTNQIMTGRTLVAKAVLNVADLAMEAAGGSAFYRKLGLEKLFRDVQGARYHPLREETQRKLSGQLALGWDTSSL
ncbi:acyl-CoA dehydrogenase family protein [Leptolyngbya sp. GGD]|uniref:acyl-CoA dehydrogenase family protein n=1 Tax=Leptolyngbya sp. GGD TaxID=2997907 RepID=UPI00227BD0F4|nr:acyl-CoA dehydrogenase family protein [Leptolyngbya sp. GGD]MCY6491601.1 acyl-CoA dehydrogenase family protein [Leptolyngbya sp. GGD]